MNKNDTKCISSKKQHLLVATPAEKSPPKIDPLEPPLTIESLKALGRAQAMEWVGNVSDLRTKAPLMAWRDNCRDEIHDILPSHSGIDYRQKVDLLNAWTSAFDAATGNELAALRDTVGDGRDDIDCAISQARDLLRLAIDEGVKNEPAGCRANAPIRAAMRYLDDIAKTAAFIDGWTTTGGVSK